MTLDWYAGRRILVVEDDYFIADDIAGFLEARGANVIGPAASVEAAMDLLSVVPQFDGAILDVNLRGEMVFTVADALQARGVPFIFATGYDEAVIPERFSHAVHCAKPVTPSKLAKALLK